MWTSSSCKHAPEHHSPLSSQPDVVVPPARALGGADRQQAATAALNFDRQPSEPPFLYRASRGHSAGATRQCFALDAALIGPHPPDRFAVARRTVRRYEVDVGAVRCERRIEPQCATAGDQGYVVDIVDQNDEMRHTHTTERGPGLSINDPQSSHVFRR